MRDISTELKELRLHGMAGAWDDLTTQEGGQPMWAYKPRVG